MRIMQSQKSVSDALAIHLCDFASLSLMVSRRYSRQESMKAASFPGSGKYHLRRQITTLIHE